MHLHEFGAPDGLPLLALHGVSDHGGRFADLAARLGRFRVIAPDLRGHGRSSSLPPWSLDQQVDDLLVLLNPTVKTSIIGHSSGGVLATRLAHAAPDRIDRLVLLDPATLSSKQPKLALANAERMRIDISYADRAEARAGRVQNGWQDIAANLLDAEIEAHLEQREDGRWHCARSPAGRTHIVVIGTGVPGGDGGLSGSVPGCIGR
jgi:lipase